MSEKTRKIEDIKNESILEIDSLKSKKPKHNSKRRKCKKKKTSQLNKDWDSKKMNDLVNYLCTTISGNESESSVESNSPFKVTKESLKIFNKNDGQNLMLPSTKYFPSTSSAEITNLFENLQVNMPNNSIKFNNISKDLNIDFINESKCKSLNLEELKASKQNEEIKASINCKDDFLHSHEKLQEYFQMSYLQKFTQNNTRGQVDLSSIPLVSELEQSFSSSFAVTEININKNMHFSNSVKSFVDTNHEKSTSELFITELKSKLVKTDIIEKNKKGRKKNSWKENVCSSVAQDKESIKNKNNILNPEVEQNDNSSTKKKACQITKIKKRQQSSKNPVSKNDTKFPKFLSEEELKSISDSIGLLTGIIRINQKNYKEAYITAPDKGMDILIEGLRDRNRALEGDEVYFILKPKEHFRTCTDSADVQRTAVVVGIKTFNHNRGAVGTLNVIKNKNDNFVLFSPRDLRLPRIRVKKKNWPKGFLENSESFKHKLYFAKILQWNDLRFADGELVKEIGIIGNIESETDAILLKYELDVTPYSESLKKFIPSLTFTISEHEILNREDLRGDCIFTIDPATAVDLDDAVSCKKLPNGNYEIGVHISDVSYFLKEGTPLDDAVSKRATTIYLVQKAYHMLPFELTQLCSLTPGEDKLSFSVIWEITPDYNILRRRFARTVINSCAKFSYDQVQSIIEGTSSKSVFPKIHGNHSLENIKNTIIFLNKLAMYLRCKRFDNGALRIDQKKIYFVFNEHGLPIDFHVEVHEQSHQLIEEFMLLANITVAEKLHNYFPKIAFLRSHAPPLDFILKRYQKSLEKYGIILDISSSGALHKSLLKYSGDDLESVARILVLNNLIAKPMARAKYYCSSIYPNAEDRRHYALNVPLYTHFTSPIRRYADVMTHRLLAASLSYSETPNWTVDYVQDVASNCNKQKYAAKMAQEMSTELFLSVYIGEKGSVICEAVVCDIKDKSFDCIGLTTGSHQRLYFEHIKGTLHQEKEDGILRLTIKWPKDENHDRETIQIIQMFSIVKIELKRLNVLKTEARLLRYD